MRKLPHVNAIQSPSELPCCFPPTPGLPSLHVLPLLPLLPFLSFKPLLDWQKLLLKHAQLVLACQKLQNKTAHPAEAQPTDPEDDGDNSQAIALMRKTFFADVDEYERSGHLKIPPMLDPDPQCGAGILPAPNLNIPTVPDPNPAGNPESVKA